MYFSSLLFLFVFLPIVLAVYYIVPRKFGNAFLLLANLVFYGWGEPVFILIMIVSVVSNYIFGLLIEKYRDNQKRKKTFLVLSLIISLGLLADTTMDCPLTGNIYILMDKDRPKTICSAFDEQLDISESLYKMNLKFRFTKKDVTELLENAEGYSDEIRKRVETIIFAQMRKYPYLFLKT